MYKIIASASPISLFQGNGFSYFRNAKRVWPELVFFPESNERDASELLAEVTRLARDGRIPPWCLPSPSNSSLSFYRGLRSLQFYEGKWSGMIWYPQPIVPQKPERTRIETISSDDNLSIWVALVGSNLLGNEATEPELFRHLMVQQETEFYLGYYNDEPVSAAMTFMHNGVMGLYFMVTHPSFQGKGIGGAVVQLIQQKAYLSGVNNVILQATNEGFTLYRNQGFQIVGPLAMFNLLQYQRLGPVNP